MVKVIHNNLTKEESLRIERKLIRDLNPAFNVAHKIPNITARDFGTDYVTLSMLREYKSQYTDYFESISGLGDDAIVHRILGDVAVAEDMFRTGHSENLIRLCGEGCFYKTPFFVKHNGSWVVNRAAYNLFDSTAEEISILF